MLKTFKLEREHCFCIPRRFGLTLLMRRLDGYWVKDRGQVRRGFKFHSLEGENGSTTIG